MLPFARVLRQSLVERQCVIGALQSQIHRLPVTKNARARAFCASESCRIDRNSLARLTLDQLCGLCE